MVAIENSFGEVSAANLNSFEVRAGMVLPDDYKTFLLSSNGGKVSPNEIDVPGQEAVLVDLLYGICEKRKPGDLEYEIARLSDTLTKAFLPIGHDPGGNSFLLGLEGTQSGRVYYWDSSLFFEESSEEQNTYLLFFKAITND